MGAVDELLAAWRNNPDADATVALCSYLGVAKREDLIREVAASAETWHAQDAEVLLSVGRMYLDAGMLPEAQSTLVAAGKVEGQNYRPFRYLGEVLLRRGDAVRAEKILARAVSLGGNDRETRHLHERAAFYLGLQKRRGLQAVASEVARAVPKQVSIPAPALGPGEPMPTFDSADAIEISSVLELEETGLSPSASVTRPRPKNTLHGPGPVSPGVGFPSRSPQPRARGIPSNAVDLAEDVSAAAVSSPSMHDLSAAAVLEASEPSLPRFGVPAVEPALPAPTRSFAAGPFAARPVSAPPPAPPARPRSMPPPAPTPPPVAAEAMAGEAVHPPARLVLEHLARVGVFEPGGGAAPAWEKAPKVPTRGGWLLTIVIVLLLGAGGGIYEYARRLKAERTQHAQDLMTKVDQALHSGRPGELRATNDQLSEVFELDSLSQRAARLWLHNRVLGPLLLTDQPRGIDSAIHRGRTVGLPDHELAVGRIASFLVEGDVSGAAAMLPKSDTKAAKDPYYQLLAGAVLERVGDPRAAERYDAARRLDPKLAPAFLLLARLVLLEQGVGPARPIIDELKKKLGDGPGARAIEALAWVVDPERPAALPEAGKIADADADRLPAPLLAVPAMVHAVEAMRADQLERANQAIDSAIGSTSSPALAARLGFLAIEAGNERLARKAALRALALAALHPNARALAARVALLGGRLDEAQKVAEGLDPASIEVRVVQGVVAYEKGDVDSLDRILGGEEGSPPELMALRAGHDVLLGKAYPDEEKIKAMTSSSVLWGELVALDAALDTGDLELARSLVAKRRPEDTAPTHLMRLARLERYSDQLDAALAASQRALSTAPPPSLVVERVYELIESKDLSTAEQLVARYEKALGPAGDWVSALLEVSTKQYRTAKKRLAGLDPPTGRDPPWLRVLAARALVSVGDRRARGYIGATARKLGKHPDLLWAAKAL